MDSAASRHRRIAGLTTRIFTAAIAIIISITGTLGIGQGLSNQSQDTAHDKAVAEANFWQIVSGDAAPKGATSVNKLAIDLKKVISESNTDTSAASSAIDQFVAGPSEYPSVENDLGVQLFDSANQTCVHCGPLNSYAVGQLELIQQGKVNLVAKTVIDSHPASSGVTLTPFGVNPVIWVGFVYLATGTIAALYAVRRDSRKNDYPAILLNWKSDGGSSADPSKRIVKFLSPGYVYGVVPILTKLGKGFEAILAQSGQTEKYISAKAFLDRVRQLPDSEQKARLVDQTERIMQRIMALVARSASSGEHFDELDHHSEANDISRGLDELSSQVETYESALKEVSDPLAEIDQLLSDPPARRSRRTATGRNREDDSGRGMTATG